MNDFNLNDMRRMHWSQPVEQQTRDAIAGMTDEQRMLETWLNDSPECESAHTWVGNEHCSVKVTHRLHIDCWGDAVNVCERHIVSWRRRALSGVTCSECDRLIRECGHPVPV